VTGGLTPHAQAIQARLKAIIDGATAEGRSDLNPAELAEVDALLDRLDADDMLRIIAHDGLG
jgi:hypothetical protein